MALDPARVKALFQAVIEQPDHVERRAFLDREVGDDTELRDRLNALLAAYEQPPGALDAPLDANLNAGLDTLIATQSATSPSVSSGQTRSYQTNESPALLDSVIAGRYKIRQQIGEGGMGTVYVAEQIAPVKRQVALKLIKPGMDSKTVLARFEAERQALALMDHPHIAKVLDAGATEHGRPFFVMELVKGIPLTEYCDQHRLALPDRLTLFRHICSAVHHAHQKGIIHRDLKPTNILIESHDGHPVPKVIDFGLAKATSGLQLSEHSLFSAFGTVAGTPLYMAPEQANFNAIDVDTRADIYALGVILYELLTGSTPIHRDTFKRAALDEMLRLIREVEPPPPSHRISSSDTRPSIAANRHIEPAKLTRFVRGDLDWIVMKALAKERSRRYDSAIGLANDIERFHNHEPVSAGPPTARYRLKKFVQRNRGRVISASLVLLALVCGIIGATWGLLEANRQRILADARRKDAEKRLAQKDKANEILLSIFQDLDPRGGDTETPSLSYRLGKRLDIATDALEGEATDDPLGVARLQSALGMSQLALGYAEKAIILLAKARATFTSRLGPEHPDTLISMVKLATAYLTDGKLDRALPLFEESLPLLKAKLGPSHRDTLACMQNLAAAYQQAGKVDRAVALFEETLALQKTKFGSDHLDTQNGMNNLAMAYNAAGKFDLAVVLLEETLARKKTTIGPYHPDTLGSMNNLAAAYDNAGKRDAALPLITEALALCKANLGPDHPHTLISMGNLASAYLSTGKLDRALPLFEETLALQKTKLAPGHPDTLLTMVRLAGAYQSTRKGDRALSLLEEALPLLKSKRGPDHTDTLACMQNLAHAYWSAGRLDRSIPLLEETLKRRAAMSGPDHQDTLGAKANLGVNYKDAGRLADALPLLEAAYQMSGKSPVLRRFSAPLLETYVRLGQTEKAAKLAREVLAEARASWPTGSPQLAVLLAQMAFIFLNDKSWTDAEPILRDCLAIREKIEPDAWTTFNTKSMLGAALLGQKKYADAEPLLRAGYDGLKSRADKIPLQGKIRLAEALDRLIALAEATNKPDDAKQWKEEKAKLPSETAAPNPRVEKK
jgi:eukaryotic-like serine/threonine-protein kinase